jgi:hypothetical protein
MTYQEILVRQINGLIVELNDLIDLDVSLHRIESVKSKIDELELKLQSL